MNGLNVYEYIGAAGVALVAVAGGGGHLWAVSFSHSGLAANREGGGSGGARRLQIKEKK